ncbi:MAG: hypothetical protein AMXMBFR4_24010 [Candidatus Hydrogenedentota bacterium]
MSLAVLICAQLLGAPFLDLHTVPLGMAEEHVEFASFDDGAPDEVAASEWVIGAFTFVADVDGDGRGEVVVDQEGTLQVVYRQRDVLEIKLPNELLVYDIADLDGDGTTDLVGLTANAAVRAPIRSGEIEWTPLFDTRSRYSNMVNRFAVPAVLAVRHKDGVRIGIPAEQGVEIRGIDGSLFDSIPYQSTGGSFSDDSFETRSSRGEGGLELRVFRRLTRETHTVPDIAEMQAPPVRARSSGRHMEDLPEGGEREWAWVRVHADSVTGRTIRAYVREESGFSCSVCIASLIESRDGTAAEPVKLGPARSYPGKLYAQPHDVNGDGFSDLLLWNTPVPATSVDSLMRTLTGRTWPVTLTVHLFSPGKERFEPKPATLLTVRLPVAWFLSGTLFDSDALGDFNGDGTVDLAMRTGESEYSIWLFSDGFAQTPDEVHQLPEPITRREFVEDLDGTGKFSIVLRSAKHIYVFYPK